MLRSGALSGGVPHGGIFGVLVAVLVLLLLVVVGLAIARRPLKSDREAAGPLHAVAAVKGVPGSGVGGFVSFSEPVGGQGTVVTAQLAGLAAGSHGFHIHEKGDTRARCEAAGAHYNPHGHAHGGPNAAARHAGDLGNIIAGANGVAAYHRFDPDLSLRGPHSVVGRTVVVHRDADDYGLGGQADSPRTGNAGPRVACGVIALGSV